MSLVTGCLLGSSAGISNYSSTNLFQLIFLIFTGWAQLLNNRHISIFAEIAKVNKLVKTLMARTRTNNNLSP